MISRAGVGAALAAIALIIGACTYSINPLSAPGDSKPDARLEGVWQGVSPNDKGYYLIFYAHVVPTDNGLMEVDWVVYGYNELGHASPLEWTRLRVFRTEIDGAQYLNVMPVAGQTGKKWEGTVYFIFKYDISQDGVLTIWVPSDEALHTLHRDIEEGRLAGIKKYPDSTPKSSGSIFGSISIPDWIVTGSAADLREYLRQGKDPFTQHHLTLRKILPKVPVP